MDQNSFPSVQLVSSIYLFQYYLLKKNKRKAIIFFWVTLASLSKTSCPYVRELITSLFILFNQFSYQSKRKPMPKCSNYHTIALSPHASKILQARLQQYMNYELPGIQAVFRKARRTRDQIANICWIIEKAREFQKNMNFCFIDYTKAFDCVDHNKPWKILKETGRNTRPPYLPPEKSVCKSRSNS